VSISDHRDGSGTGPVKQLSRASNLVQRAVSAAILAPIALGFTVLGGWSFVVLCAIGAGAILWEWTALIERRADPRILVPGLLALAASAIMAGLGLSVAALGAVVIGAALAVLATVAWPRRALGSPSLPWIAGGVVYSSAILLAPVLLRRDPDWGLAGMLFVLLSVWANDIFAYFGGRTIGGPLLWPKVSPKKTWSGAIGGLIGGVAAGVVVAYASGAGRLWMTAVVALLLSISAEGGDLLESAIKRRFGAKDTSRLIPGHGGLMDRLDSFLVAALLALLIGIIRAGTAAPARGFLIW
jgi:phosphatidate cytidylyltransferase